MSVKIDGQLASNVQLCNMRDGQIGRITRWGPHSHYVGFIIQYNKYSKTWFQIGGEHSWSNGSTNVFEKPEFTVEILPNGTTLRIENNT